MTRNESKLVKLFHGNSKRLCMGGRKLKRIPVQLPQLFNLLVLELQNNNLQWLPENFYLLSKLEFLNLGNNDFDNVPHVIETLTNLKKLYLYGNSITRLNGNVLEKLKNLSSLNLNNNKLIELPPEIGSMVSLEILSLDGNYLEELPFELCLLSSLRQLRVCNNKLQSLPLEIGLLRHMTKMYLSQNRIKELPEGFCNLNHLNVLDVAGNELRIFPTETQNMPLRELYCESNPLLEEVPVHSVQEEEVLSLKELAARYVMKEVKNKSSPVRRMIAFFPGAREMLSQASRCAVCSEAFLNTWLECVKFVKAKQDLKIDKCPSLLIPVRALLCSYKCFNLKEHGFYGVAFP